MCKAGFDGNGTTCIGQYKCFCVPIHYSNLIVHGTGGRYRPKYGNYSFTPIFPCYWLKLTLLSRNARENENNRFDEISSNRVNVYRFDDHGESQSNASKRNQLGGINDFDEFLVKFLKTELAWRI